MNEFYLGDNTRKSTKSKVDFTYDNMLKDKNSGKSLFQILSQRSSTNVPNINPKEIYDANNKVNKIILKNLKTLYNENKNDSRHLPLYKNVDNLLKKSHNSNKYLYSQILNYQNNNKQSYINENKEKEITEDEMIRSVGEMSNRNSFLQASFQNSDEKRKQFEKSPINKSSNNKLDINFKFQNSLSKSFNKGKKQGYNNIKTKNCSNLKNKKTQQEDEKKNKLKKLFKEKSIRSERHNSSFLLSNNSNLNFSNTSNYINNELNNSILNKQNMKTNFNLNMKKSERKSRSINYNIKSDIKTPKAKKNLIGLSNKELKIPTLNEINSAINKILISNHIQTMQKENNNLEKNDTFEKICKTPKNKLLLKMNNHPRRKSYMPKSDNNLMKDLSKTKLLLNETHNHDNQNEIKDDEFQKKYRQLLISKNLYDSLDDDEEVLDEEEEENYFYISTNSFAAYLLDLIILISSFIELYYLPIYISSYISDFNIHQNIINTIIFYFIDFIYILDLITGFFKAYYNFEEVLITKNGNICLHYLTGWFILDLIEAIPFFTILDNNMKKIRKNFFTSNSKDNNIFDFVSNNKYFVISFIKVIKIFKIYSKNIVLKGIKKFFTKIQFFFVWKGLFSALLITFSSLHICTCLFIFIGKNEFQGWITNNNLQDKNFIDIYMAALYYQMATLTTVGYGDITATNGFEKIYGIIVLIVGTCAYSWILTYISNYIKKKNEKYIDFEKKIDILDNIKLECPNLGPELYFNIRRYLIYNKSVNQFNLKFVLESLPPSLQNNLIVEIYKPIIENFQFFKSFENSDFFVKIVTSLKSILSMKDDILIQEGDIIEDIIFVKKGILTLEIIIDLNNAKKSIESHLEMTGMECFKNISNDKFNVLMNLSSINNTTYKPEFGKKIFSQKAKQKKEIKIIDLRDNEHFGDILMILNEKSPLTVKVKSRKAELFFLQKTEATEISNRYPHIWKRIVNRSLHNMKQIKRIIRKKALLFSVTYNIPINPEFRKMFLKQEQKEHKLFLENILNNGQNKKKLQDKIDTIIEENESNIFHSQIGLSTHNNYNKSTKDQTQAQSNYLINIINHQDKNKKDKSNNSHNDNVENTEKVNESNYTKNSKNNKQKIENKDSNNFLNASRKSKIFINEEKNSDINENILNKENAIINIVDKELKKSNKKAPNQITNVSINIYSPKIQIPLNKLNIENQNVNYFEEKEEKTENNNPDKINDEISYNNNEFIIDVKNNSVSMDNSDENSNIFYSNINKREKGIEFKSYSDKFNSNIMKLFEKEKVEKIVNKVLKNEKSEIKTNDKISNKSINIISNEKRKEINDENITEKTSKNKFTHLNSFQSTSFTINSIYENINQISNFEYNKDSNLRESTKEFILDKISKKKEDNFEIPKTIKNKNKFASSKCNIKIKKRFNQTINIKPVLSNHLLEHLNIKNEKSDKKINTIGRKSEDKKFLSSIHNKKRKIFFKNFESIDKDKIKSSKMNYNKLISKNIEKNQKNLNNPEEYFKGFFNEIISHDKNNILLNKVPVKKKKTPPNNIE